MAGVRVVQGVRAPGLRERPLRAREPRACRTRRRPRSAAAALLNPALLLVVNLGLAGALWVGGGLVIDGKIELGSVFVLLNYLVAVMIPLVLLSVLLPQIASADSSVGAHRSRCWTRSPTCRTSPDAPTLAEAIGGEVHGRVAFEDVTFAYLGPDGQPNPTPVLRDIDLVAEPGQVVAILGATGSGKSTLVNLISRSYDVTDGRVTIDGVDVRDVTRASLLEAVTPVLQQPSLFSGTIEREHRVRRRRGRRGTIDVVTAARAAEAADVRRGPSRRLPRRGQAPRRELLGRAAPAPLDRARARAPAADPDPRRHDERARRRDRGARAGRDPRADGRQHRLPRRPAHQRGAHRRRDRRARGGPDRREGRARGAARVERGVPVDLRVAARGRCPPMPDDDAQPGRRGARRRSRCAGCSRYLLGTRPAASRVVVRAQLRRHVARARCPPCSSAAIINGPIADGDKTRARDRPARPARASPSAASSACGSAAGSSPSPPRTPCTGCAGRSSSTRRRCRCGSSTASPSAT